MTSKWSDPSLAKQAGLPKGSTLMPPFRCFQPAQKSLCSEAEGLTANLEVCRSHRTSKDAAVDNSRQSSATPETTDRFCIQMTCRMQTERPLMQPEGLVVIRYCRCLVTRQTDLGCIILYSHNKEPIGMVLLSGLSPKF